MEDLRTSLKSVRWTTAFGNDHDTLIGLLVDWWISSRPSERWAIEEAPTFSSSPNSRGVGSEKCDAVLFRGESAVGVVEVHGQDYGKAIRRIGKYFSAENPDVESLEFAVLLAYPYPPARSQTVASPPLTELVQLGRELTEEHPTKQLAILALAKRWEWDVSGLRAKNNYSKGRAIRVRGVLIRDGEVVREGLDIIDGSVEQPHHYVV